MSAPQGPILRLGHNACRIARADFSGAIVDAADYYRAFVTTARLAQRTMLVSGWQFDTGVELKRGDDAAPGEIVKLMPFLNELCERNENLHIYILAWDFHPLFLLEREWMQELLFEWRSHRNIHFRFDVCEAPQGSHHQKFVVIDRALAFMGGIDLCEARWDDRRHLTANELRTSHGKPSKPYHDVQAYLVGADAADALREIFIDRWSRTEGESEPLELPSSDPTEAAGFRLPGDLQLGAGPVALSRTDYCAEGGPVREVEKLFIDAIAAAEKLIYIETQYFSSRSIRAALIARIHAADRPLLEIVIVLNEKAEALKEEIAVGLRQADNVQRIRKAASESGHALGVYHSLSDGEGEDQRATYIHSKLLAVDDRFLTIGTANLTNRSMSIDTELHASWEAEHGTAEGRSLSESIARVRASLLAEHVGTGEAGARQWLPIEGLVRRLDAAAGTTRLRHHGPPTATEEAAMTLLDPEDLPFDPEGSESDRETLAAEQDASKSSFFDGVAALWERLKA